MITLERILNLMEERGCDNQQLASALNLNRQVVTDWRAGRSKSYKKYLYQIANFFSVSTDYLLGKSDDRVDERILDIVNTIDNDILENSGGNLLKAIQEQKERDEKDIAKIMSVFNEDEKLLLSKYEKLNRIGKNKTHDYIDDLSEHPKYIASGASMAANENPTKPVIQKNGRKS